MNNGKIVITGGTGMIGKVLANALYLKGYEVIIISRSLKKSFPYAQTVSWKSSDLFHAIDGSKAVINLAGKNIGTWPWTYKTKLKIVQSRVLTGHILTQVIEKCNHKPEVFIQASATGYYGHKTNQPVSEDERAGSGFLPELCQKWEESTSQLEKSGIRWIAIRTGLVLSWHGGYLKKLRLGFNLFLGGHFVNGLNFLPWIHINDIVEAILWMIEQKSAKGVFNLVSPNTVNMKQFCQVFGKYTNRPSWLHIPAFALKIIFGKTMTNELLLANQNITPKRLTDSGFIFRFGNIEQAIENIVKYERYSKN